MADQSKKIVIKLLRWVYFIVPVAAGLDKFTNLLTDWAMYLSPALDALLPLSPARFMMAVGVVEIAAGLLVLTRPRIGAFVVMSWLMLIALTLLASGKYLDVAVRDLAMAAGALALGQLVSGRTRARREDAEPAEADTNEKRKEATHVLH
jgi:hypothetical protein